MDPSPVESSSNAASRAFLQAAHAVQHWDLVELREALRLPDETPLDRLADVVARLHHLPTKTAESIEAALRRSDAREWIERNRDLRELSASLPAVFAYLAIDAPTPLSTR